MVDCMIVLNVSLGWSWWYETCVFVSGSARTLTRVASRALVRARFLPHAFVSSMIST
jgi:hypothetical protein